MGNNDCIFPYLQSRLSNRNWCFPEAKEVNAVIEKSHENYAAVDVKKYYSKFDVAVEVVMG